MLASTRRACEVMDNQRVFDPEACLWRTVTAITAADHTHLWFWFAHQHPDGTPYVARLHRRALVVVDTNPNGPCLNP